MMTPRCNYDSIRSKKARLAVFIRGYLLVILYIAAILFLSVGILLVMTGVSAGWLSIGLSVIPAMLVEWFNGELKSLRIAKQPRDIDDVLSWDVLSKMPKRANPKTIATILSETSGGRFFAARFGISPRFLQEIASVDPNDMGGLWREALALRIQTNSSEISSGMLVVALIKSSPDYISSLSHLQLDIDRLVEGIRWFNRLNEMTAKKPVFKSGGLARDWSFGWTPLLDRFGVNISRQIVGNDLQSVKYSAHNEAVDQLINIFSKNGRQNAVLVGLDGSGKTEIIKTFASRIIDGSNKLSPDLMYRQVFMLDAASLISAAHKDGIEAVVNRIFNEALSAKNVIVCFDNAHLFLEDAVGSVDISNLISSVIADGRLRVVLALNDQQMLKLKARNPELVGYLNKIIVDAPSENDVIKILQNQAVIVEYQYKVIFMYQSIQEIYSLSNRYIYDIAMPGKALNLMELVAESCGGGLISSETVRSALEKTMNIKISSVDDDERDKLSNLEKLLHERVVGQTHAVDIVSNAIRRSRAGVRNQNRPIGVFMFLGPTGVGKTELAKALSDVYFGIDSSIIRLDMNEFSGVNDCDRLIEDSSTNPNSLTAMVMKKPFSIVLLDEIEKAHPNVILALLQLLDEGIMRDVNNREINFRDTIVIATSNAGASRLCELMDRGISSVGFEEKFIEELVESKLFKPEFLNRFDEIVTFSPLSKDELFDIADIIIAGINKTLDPQKITVRLDLDAKSYLIDKSYNPDMGARPLRRIFQRTVENIIAAKMLKKEIMSGCELNISVDQLRDIYEKEK